METDSLPIAEQTQPKLRWFHPAPGRLLIFLLAVEGVLLLSKPWFPKGYAVLTAIAAVIVAMLLMFVWWLVALCFRWRFQFSLRSLLVLTVAVAIPFSWLAVEIKKAREQRREQREAVETIHRLGGEARYNYQLEGRLPPALFRATWLQKLLGDNFFADVAEVHLSGTQATDAALGHLKGGLSQLVILSLDKTQVTDAGLEHLKGLSQLSILHLHNTQVTDAGLKHLRGLTGLIGLWLDNTQVTDAGLEHLKGLTQLRALSLVNTNVTDVGLEHLKGLTQLRGLRLDHTHVTDKGVKKLQQALPNCRITTK